MLREVNFFQLAYKQTSAFMFIQQTCVIERGKLL